MELSSESSSTDLINPPNLCWRVGLALNHEKLYFCISNETQVTNIIVRLEGHNISSSIPFRELQLLLYDLMLQIEERLLDHFGSCLAVNGCLVIESFFASSEQIVKCFEAIKFTKFTSIFHDALANFASFLSNFEISVNLVMFSNLNSRLHLITPENAELSFKLLYPDRPAIPILHINDHSAYTIIKKSYDKIMMAFPNFFGEGGNAVDFKCEPTIGFEMTSETECQGNAGNDEVTKEEILALSGKILIKSAKVFGVALGLSNVDVDNLLHNHIHQDSIIMNLLYEAKKQDKLTRKSLTRALASIKEFGLAKMIDQTFVPPAVLNNGQTNDSDNVKMEVDDKIIGLLKFYDTQLAMKYLELSAANAIAFWKLLHKEIGSIISESLKPYDAYLGKNEISSFITQVIFKQTSDVLQLAVDIASNRYTTHVEAQLIKIGFKGKLGIEFKLNGKMASPQNCLNLCSELLLLKQKRNEEWQLNSEAACHSSNGKDADQLFKKVWIPKVGKQVHDGSVHFTDKNKLFFFIRKKDPNAIKLIEQQSIASLTEADANGYLSIHCAAQFGNVAALQAILHKGINIDIRTLNHLTPLHVAANCGQAEIVEILLKEGANKEATNNKGLTPLRVACSHNYSNIVQILLQNGANVQTQCHQGFTPLHASIKGDASVVKVLLHHGANPLMRDNDGYTPLKRAVDYKKFSAVKAILTSFPKIQGAKECLEDNIALVAISVFKNDPRTCKLLLENGADPNAFYHGCSILHFACEKGFTEIIEVLIEHGANKSLCIQNRGTPLIYATATGQYGSALKLLKLGADPNLKDHLNAIGGISPLEFAIINKKIDIAFELIHAGANVNEMVMFKANSKGKQPIFHLMVQQKMMKLIELAVTKQVDVVATNTDNNNTALHVAAGLNFADIVKFLCQAGANVDIKGSQGRTPLAIAICQESYAAAIALLEFKADVNAYTSKGDTPLILALDLKMFELAEELIQRGASVKSVNNNGLSVISAACHGGNKKIIKAIHNVFPELASNIMSQLDDVDTENSAVRGAMENPEVLEYLLEIGVDPNALVVSEGTLIMSLLHLAFGASTTESIKVLLKHKADPNVNFELVGSPLYFAVAFEHVSLEIVELLLNAKANPNLRLPSENGASPLYAAVHNGSYDKAKLLLEHGADPMLPVSSVGSTVLHIVAFYNYSEMTELLLNYIVNPDDCKSNGNTTALQVAAARGSNEVLSLLSTAPQCDINLQDENGITALLHATIANEIDSAIALISLGAQVNRASHDMVTPLMEACKHGAYELAEMIIQNGANIGAQNINGESALHISCRGNHAKLVELLLENGAPVNLKTNQNRTPIMETNSTNITELLLKHGAEHFQKSSTENQKNNNVNFEDTNAAKSSKYNEPELSMPKFLNSLFTHITSDDEKMKQFLVKHANVINESLDFY